MGGRVVRMGRAAAIGGGASRQPARLLVRVDLGADLSGAEILKDLAAVESHLAIPGDLQVGQPPGAAHPAN